eukprot:8146963-Pyramimonas_sp.AAC.1
MLHNVPHWLSQRMDGEAPPARVYQAEGNAPAGGGPPNRGAWPRSITPSFWGTDVTHNETWQNVVVFNGR